MPNLHIGECVTFHDRAYLVRGVTPMSTAPRRVLLESVATREQLETATEQVVRVERPTDGSRSERPKRWLRPVG
jgi:hypothetical protein